jgi:hypothetical protein
MQLPSRPDRTPGPLPGAESHPRHRRRGWPDPPQPVPTEGRQHRATTRTTAPDRRLGLCTRLRRRCPLLRASSVGALPRSALGRARRAPPPRHRYQHCERADHLAAHRGQLPGTAVHPGQDRRWQAHRRRPGSNTAPSGNTWNRTVCPVGTASVHEPARTDAPPQRLPHRVWISAVTATHGTASSGANAVSSGLLGTDGHPAPPPSATRATGQLWSARQP